jgi:hypothetical protein
VNVPETPEFVKPVLGLEKIVGRSSRFASSAGPELNLPDLNAISRSPPGTLQAGYFKGFRRPASDCKDLRRWSFLAVAHKW